MNSSVELIHMECEKAIDNARTLCFATRGSELQEEAANTLKALRERVTELKKQVVTQSDEESANLLLGWENLLTSYIEELNMWVAIKADRMGTAWTSLVLAQRHLSWALRAHPSMSYDADRVERLHDIEHVVFPPQLYSSIGGVVTKTECSICGKEYGECDHVVGRAYMGEFCCRIIRKMDLKEVSLVEEPEDKLCRIASFQDGAVVRDYLTLRPVETRRVLD